MYLPVPGGEWDGNASFNTSLRPAVSPVHLQSWLDGVPSEKLSAVGRTFSCHAIFLKSHLLRLKEEEPKVSS